MNEHLALILPECIFMSFAAIFLGNLLTGRHSGLAGGGEQFPWNF